MLQDSFGRTIHNLRISVTDRCNFRCRYCMPEEGMIWMKKAELLSFEELTRLARLFAELGVTKIRLTGGEPLMRKELHVLIRQLHAIPGIEDIALTTNGFFLAEQVDALEQAGLNRINVSMDSLNPQRFMEMVRRDYLDKVWEGLEAVERSSIRPIKINAVLMRGLNDSEIEAFAHLARTRPFIIRFIEFMPLGAEDGWTMDKVVPTQEIIRRIDALGVPLQPIRNNQQSAITGEPADRYRFEDGVGEIGFISSVSEPFCGSCNRVRITSDGKLRTCLFSLHETDLRQLVRSNASDQEIKSIIVDAVWKKEEGHLINRPGFVRPDRTMSSIGG